MAQHPAFLLIDRTAVLFCGVVAGIAIGLALAPQINGWLADAPPPVLDQAPVSSRITAAPAAGAVPVIADQPVPAGLARAVAAARPFRIGVFGDSFGDGLWSALYNQLPRHEAFQVLRYAEQGTGFTRYAQKNLEDSLAGQLAQGPVDIAVISFGANDVQGIYVAGKVAPLLSPAWQTEIAARITRYVGALQAQGAQVYWVGLPVMRDAGFDAQIRALNSFYAALMARLDVPFVDTRAAAADANGQFASHLPDTQTGLPWLVRAGDGIHMSMKGYRLLTDDLAMRIRKWGQAARAGRQVPAGLVPPPVLDPPKIVAAVPATAPGASATTATPQAKPPPPPGEPTAPASAPTNLLPDIPPQAQPEPQA